MERDVNVQDAFKLEGQNISGFLDKTYEAAVCVNRLVSVDQQPQCFILVRKNVSHDVQWDLALPDWQSINQPTCWKRRHYRSNRQALKMNDQTCRQICRNIQPESGIALVVNPLPPAPAAIDASSAGWWTHTGWTLGLDIGS